MPALIALRATVVLRRGDGDARAAARGVLSRRTRRRRSRPASSSRRSASRRARRARCCARTRSASATTRTSRRCSRASRLTLDDGGIASARIGCGGVAATPARARATEARARGRTRGTPTTAERAASVAGERVRADRRHARVAQLPAHGARQSAAPLLARNRAARRDALDARRRRCAASVDAMNAPHPPCSTATCAGRRRAGAARFRGAARRRRSGVHRRPAGAARHAARGRRRQPGRARTLERLDLDAVRATPGVVAVHHRGRYSRASTTSARSSTTIRSSPSDVVQFAGQPVFAVAATSVQRRAPRGNARRRSTSSRCPRS